MPESDYVPFVLCPVCSTRSDAERWGVQRFECGSCGTWFVVDLDPDKVATHGMAG